MKYRLKKDLPTFRTGDVFELRDDGCLYLWNTFSDCRHWKRTVMAYHKITLDKFPNILKEWFEPIREDVYMDRRSQAEAILRRDIKNFAPGRSACGEYEVRFDMITSMLTVCRVVCLVTSSIRFKTPEDAYRSISRHRNEWLTYLGVENG